MKEETFEEKKKRLEAALKQSDAGINSIIKEIQDGDTILKSFFIDYFNSFIIKSISVALGKSVDMRNSEECSIGLIAFNEAIDNFDEGKNGKFLNFAKMLIQKRINEYLKQANEVISEVAFTKESDTYKNDLQPNLNKHYKEDLPHNSIKQYKEDDYKKEMQHFEKLLSDFNLKIESLVDIVPKHNNEKKSCIYVAKILAINDELFNDLKTNHKIPINELLKVSKVDIMNIQRNGSYIIALALIFKYDFEIFKSYVDKG